jgi:protoporphyrinogen/coproporphyrinogen III oxidase
MSHVLIVGGGITGLAAAWELQQQGVDYTLLEASDRLGGKIVTERADGFIIDGGPDSFLVQKPWAWQLCREIGIADRLIGTNDRQRNVYVLRNGKLQLFPRGMRLIVPLDPDGLLHSDLLSDEGKRRMLAEPDIPPRTEVGDESLASFVERRFGQEALEVFGDSLLAGIHVSDPATLSMDASFPNYVALERKYGSLIRGMQSAAPPTPDPDMPKTAFVSFPGGMVELIDGLRAALTGDIRTGQAVTRIDPEGAVETSTGGTFTPDAVIVTTPVHAASNMLGPVSRELAHILASIKAVSSGTVSLGFRADDLPDPLDGFGFVIPHSEPTRILACTWSSTKLSGRAPQGHVLIRVFVGGRGREADVDLPDDQQISLARSELRQIMNITTEPVISRVFRYRNANPQYEVGHPERVAQIMALCPPWLYLAGCTFDGVGIPDCVRQGRESARRVIASLQDRQAEKRL